MQAGHTSRWISRGVDKDIQTIDDQLVLMATRCQEQLALALEAFWDGSKVRTADVERGDVAIDAAEKLIDDLLLRALALRQPMASDLRRLTASLKIVTDLERVGDEGVNIARGSAPVSPKAELIRACLHRLAEVSQEMLGSATRSFLRDDSAAAAQVFEARGPINALYQEVLDGVIAFVAMHTTEVASALSCLEAAKCLRRIAEHAENIAEGTLFVVGTDEEPMPR